uniref:ZP domain-containing protein n=1 Tax=Anopheles merus TaxID=30066 RepID=A0A182V3V8_ANOME
MRIVFGASSVGPGGEKLYARCVRLMATGQDTEFAPHVTATCKSGTMNIKILFAGPYNGVVHARDFRTPACMTFGNGTASLGLSLNLLAKSGNSEYCGILVSNVSGGDVSNLISRFF